MDSMDRKSPHPPNRLGNRSALHHQHHHYRTNCRQTKAHSGEQTSDKDGPGNKKDGPVEGRTRSGGPQPVYIFRFPSSIMLGTAHQCMQVTSPRLEEVWEGRR
jgi:hypothetical protein